MATVIYMLESFLYSVNTVLPIFLLVLLGWIFRRVGFLSSRFVADSERFVFKVALPVYLFLEISSTDLADIVDLPLMLFCASGIIISFAVACLIIPRFIKDNDKRGAFIQGIYRSNFAILGILLAQSMFGDAGVEKITLILPIAIILYNVFAVTILSIYSPSDSKLTPLKMIYRIALDIIKNPLIISIALALPLMLFKISLPLAAEKTLGYLGGMATPLALISLGANFTFDSLKRKFGLALTASLIKTTILPLIMVTAAVMIGFRGVPLGIIFILFGGPAAVSSYIMAKNMRSDYELAGQIMLLTTLSCIFTLFIGIFILKSAALI